MAQQCSNSVTGALGLSNEKYLNFQDYLKTSLKKWIPDRDYPEIGYLPKELLYDHCLGEQDITKYWTEATKAQQDKHVGLTTNDLISNYELVWTDLVKQNRT